MFDTLGGKPVNSTLAFHWARLIELLYATERAKELIEDADITSTHIRNPVGIPGAGIGVVEAARGTLIHDYVLDKNALVKKANMIVATTNNAGAITMSVRNAAKSVIQKGNVNDGVLNKVEMAFRAYDPCFGCATHTLPGGMPLTVNVYTAQKKLLHTLKRPLG
jgi:F420-non-reducing hydrogenase large subunit